MLFRIRDYASALFWRACRPLFGAMGRGVRLIKPLRVVGARYCHFADNVTVQVGAYIAVLPLHHEPPVFKVGPRTMIGNHSHIIVTRRVEFGEAVLAGDRLYVSDNRHAYEDPAQPILDQGLVQLSDVHIGDGSWIGDNVTIIGCRIGRNCVIGANAVINRDIPDLSVVVGSPGRIVRRYSHETRQWKRTDPDGTFLDA